MNDWPFVSVVFLAFNRRDALGVSLDELLEHTDYPADRLEVIVVDNASTDGTADFVRERYPAVEVIRNPENVGISGWNVGIATARGDWVLALDDDCYLNGDALKTAITRAVEHDADLVSFRVRSPDGDVFNPGDFRRGDYSPGLLAYWGCSALFSRRAIEAEPFYDPNIFLWANEIELTMRLLDRGMRHLFLPEVTTVHQKPVLLPEDQWTIRVYMYNQRNWAYCAGKLLQPDDARVVLGRLLLRTALDAAHAGLDHLPVVPKVVEGFAAGLRHRRPVRPEVSRVYRDVCIDFSNPLEYVRTPSQRLRGIIDPSANDHFRQERRAGRLPPEIRDRFYPARTATLQL